MGYSHCFLVLSVIQRSLTSFPLSETQTSLHPAAGGLDIPVTSAFILPKATENRYLG